MGTRKVRIVKYSLSDKQKIANWQVRNSNSHYIRSLKNNFLFHFIDGGILRDHDENISYELVEEKIGEDFAGRIRNASCKLYEEASAYALERGIIIADTKFEFGLDGDGNLFLIDEVLTPDSSRFWSRDDYNIGVSPPSFDKQYLRDYLETLDWNKSTPGPELPQDVIENTTAKYRNAYQAIIAETS